MRGTVVAMEPAEYQQWLASKADLSMALRGRQLFLKQQCVACHSGTPSGRAPLLENLYRQRVTLSDGSTVIAIAPHCRAVIRKTILQYSDAQPLSAASSARACDTWFQLAP